jgi:hypothetical protein
VELFSVWPAKLVLRSPEDIEAARRTFEARYWQQIDTGWALDVAFAACLGMLDEVERWYDTHFRFTHVFPCGLAQEASPMQTDCPVVSWYPSMQGLGTSVIPVLEQLIQDYPDLLVVLPCWPKDVPVRFRLFSPFAGWVEASYRPGGALRVTTDRAIEVRAPHQIADGVRVIAQVAGD